MVKEKTSVSSPAYPLSNMFHSPGKTHMNRLFTSRKDNNYNITCQAAEKTAYLLSEYCKHKLCFNKLLSGWFEQSYQPAFAVIFHVKITAFLISHDYNSGIIKIYYLPESETLFSHHHCTFLAKSYSMTITSSPQNHRIPFTVMTEKKVDRRYSALQIVLKA